MGFKELQSFNLALLANQGWQIIQISDDLLQKVYKARYFPHGDFFEAKLSAILSYAWKGI